MKASVAKLGSVLITVSFLFFALALAGLVQEEPQPREEPSQSDNRFEELEKRLEDMARRLEERVNSPEFQARLREIENRAQKIAERFEERFQSEEWQERLHGIEKRAREAARARKVKIFSRSTSRCCATSCNRHGKQKSALVEPQFFPALRLSTGREHLVNHELRAQALAAAAPHPVRLDQSTPAGRDRVSFD